MEARAKARFVRVSPRKARRVIDLIRNRPAREARRILDFSSLGASVPVRKVLDSAIANAEQNPGVVADNLFVALVGMIAVDWAGLDVAAPFTFSALAVLAAVMIYRLARARGEASTREAGWKDRYINHVAFSYIALWEGFVILPALNLPLPQVSVPVVAIGVLGIGHTLIGRYKARVAPSW